MPQDFAKDYIQVNERIIAFYAKFPDGSLQSEIVELNDHLVVMRAYAYRTANDERPGIGYSSLEIPGKTPYTRGSEIENCETSAWGRAIAALGFEVKRGIASAEEVRNKSGSETERPNKVFTAADRSEDGGLVGIAKVGYGKSDFELRQGPEGPVISFRLAQGRQGVKVVANGALATSLATLRPTIEDQRVTCWGSQHDEEFTKDGRTIRYPVLTLDRIKTPDGMLPASDEPALPEPPDDVPLFEEVA